MKEISKHLYKIYLNILETILESVNSFPLEDMLPQRVPNRLKELLMDILKLYSVTLCEICITIFVST